MMELNNFHQIQFKFLHLSFQNVLNSFFQFYRRAEQAWIRNKCGYEFNIVAKVYLLVLISILELETISKSFWNNSEIFQIFSPIHGLVLLVLDSEQRFESLDLHGL